MLIIFKGKNQLIRWVYFFICIIFLAIIFIPFITYHAYSNRIYISTCFGLYLRFDLDNLQPLDINFTIIRLIYGLIVIGALILLITVLILCNKLKKGGILGIGIPCAVILASFLIIYPLLNYAEFFLFGDFLDFYFYDYYSFGFIIALVILGLFMILKERRIPNAKVNEGNTSEIMELKTNQILKHQTIRLSYLIIIGSLIILILIPYSFEYSSYSNIIYTAFFYGLVTRIDLDTLGLLSPGLDPYLLSRAIPLIAAIVLLIILLVLYKKLNKGGLLGIGIPCALLMIISPTLPHVISLLNLPNFSFIPYFYYMPSLSAAIVVLGLILKVKELKMSNMRINKVINPDEGEINLKEPTCSQCGAVIKSGAQFCIECGKEIK
ncbi:MAG: zinc ribbon domain-containing protein [Promethearchaeota archaeon]